MLSGIWPRGRSSAPGKRKDRDHVGRGPAVLDRRRSWPSSAASLGSSGEQQRRQPPPPGTVMSSFGPQASKNCTSCLRAASSFQARSRRTISSSCSIASSRSPRGVERQGEVEAGLVVVRVRLEPALELAGVAERRRLLGELERGAGAGDRRVVLLGARRHGEEALRALEIAERRDAARERRRWRRRSPGPAPARQRRARRRRRRRPRPHAHRPAARRSSAAARADRADEALDEGLTWLSGSAPMKPSTGWPLVKAITAGIDWMPSWPGICGCSSMFILTSRTLPPAAFTAFSSTGVSCLHGPHHGAQKSTSTGRLRRFLDDVLAEALRWSCP